MSPHNIIMGLHSCSAVAETLSACVQTQPSRLGSVSSTTQTLILLAVATIGCTLIVEFLHTAR